ncbi:tripartite tricarboxylate transporter substrate-binding protein [Paracraurococcus lichenis]|uniref:Tripartite tricarboxylate transporter substrate-binding protein n=1 Tax=Paracraurococcus lichenis TaxID=3064888 RepID=A0ABT9DVA2_9PROT|nr:tripartite tricarboxylate transporter substrate-binding protein [Paracraurococcus sp. LOR1-02]MDO9707822.1 tripartite tricarboxylate transporter substrate-binding protein [Paracraurococcus sp. LOR1-02]
MTMPPRPRRRTLLALAGAGLAAPGLPRAEGRYPNRSVRVVNAYSPGGTADVVCRILFGALADRMGQGFVVENRPGAAGTIAAQAVARAPADGYTLLYDATAHSVNPSLFGSRLPYDTRRDLLPVFLAMQTPNTLMRWPGFEARTVPELIALAKRNPGRLDCSSTGIGTVQHVSLELFNMLAGVRINHIVYREIAASRNDLTTGRVPLQFSNVPSTLPLTQANQAVCMAHCGPQPLEALPGVPAMAEFLPGFETWEWNGIFAPAGTPPEILQQLNTELNAVIRDPAVVAKLQGLGALVRANDIEEFAAFREQQIAFFADMVRKADIRID